MSDEDSDPEAQGIDALRLLKQGGPGAAPSTNTGTASTSQAASTPLIPLVPPQKRSRSLSQENLEQIRPSGTQKVQPGNGSGIFRIPSGSIRVPAAMPTQQDRREGSIRQHKSAPENHTSLAKELRGSKSAPDLTIPALAAIQGLKDGTLQVDRYTRLKIAAAARRVLEARELKRRSSQEREPHTPYPYPPPDPLSPLAVKSEALWETTSQELPANDEHLPEQMDTAAAGETTTEATARASPVPESLSTASAIAAGQRPTSAKANYHRPALSTMNQGGALVSTSHRPFTVTTGLPRFASGDAPSDDRHSTPQVPATPPTGNTSRSKTAQKIPGSMVLSLSDLFAPTKEGKD